MSNGVARLNSVLPFFRITQNPNVIDYIFQNGWRLRFGVVASRWVVLPWLVESLARCARTTQSQHLGAAVWARAASAQLAEAGYLHLKEDGGETEFEVACGAAGSWETRPQLFFLNWLGSRFSMRRIHFSSVQSVRLSRSPWPSLSLSLYECCKGSEFGARFSCRIVLLWRLRAWQHLRADGIKAGPRTTDQEWPASDAAGEMVDKKSRKSKRTKKTNKWEKKLTLGHQQTKEERREAIETGQQPHWTAPVCGVQCPREPPGREPQRDDLHCRKPFDGPSPPPPLCPHNRHDDRHVDGELHLTPAEIQGDLVDLHQQVSRVTPQHRTAQHRLPACLTLGFVSGWAAGPRASRTTRPRRRPRARRPPWRRRCTTTSRLQIREDPRRRNSWTSSGTRKVRWEMDRVWKVSRILHGGDDIFFLWCPMFYCG